MRCRSDCRGRSRTADGPTPVAPTFMPRSTQRVVAPTRGSAVAAVLPSQRQRPEFVRALSHAERDPGALSDDDAMVLFDATPGAEIDALAALADALRADAVGDEVTYVVNRNINFT